MEYALHKHLAYLNRVQRYCFYLLWQYVKDLFY